MSTFRLFGKLLVLLVLRPSRELPAALLYSSREFCFLANSGVGAQSCTANFPTIRSSARRARTAFFFFAVDVKGEARHLRALSNSSALVLPVLKVRS